MTCARLLNLRSLYDIPRHHQLHHVRHHKYPKPHIHIPQPESHKRCPAIRGKPDRIAYQINDTDARQIHSRHMVIQSRQQMSVEHGEYSPCRTACRHITPVNRRIWHPSSHEVSGRTRRSSIYTAVPISSVMSTAISAIYNCPSVCPRSSNNLYIFPLCLPAFLCSIEYPLSLLNDFRPRIYTEGCS